MSDTKTKVQRNGQDTSWDAALLQTPEKSAPLYVAIYHWLTSSPKTDEELEATLAVHYPFPFTPSGLRSRRNELVQTGWVTKARDEDGQVLKRRGSTGSPRIVWRAVAEGEVVEVPTTNGERVPQGTVLVQHRDHEAGMVAARRYAGWEIGDTGWAAGIVSAYLNPEQTMADLDKDGAPR